MNYNIDELYEKLNRFDNTIKSLEDRNRFIENLIEENKELIGQYISTSMLDGDKRTEERPINITIEHLATYLLRSDGVESSRKGDYTFYENEKRYRQYAIGKACIATDTSNRDDLAKEHYDRYKHDSCLSFSPYELFDFGKMTSDEKKRLIKHGLKEKDNEYSELKEIMSSAYEYIMDMLTDEKDRLIVDMLIEGRKESEIAKCIGIAQPNINKRVKRICVNKI